MRLPLLLAAALSACAGPASEGAADDALGSACPALAGDARETWACAIGDREAMLAGGELSAVLPLAALPDDANLVAVGPVEGLRGEVTAYGGQVIVSTMRRGGEAVLTGDEAREAGAIFLAFGSAPGWQAVTTARPLSGLEAVEAFVLDAAERSGIGAGPGAAFPFRIEGTPDRLRYHVIFREAPTGTPHDRAAHGQAKVPFEADGRPVRIAGVLVASGDVGRVTHPGHRAHMHAVVGDAEGAGHVDDLRLPAGTVLFLPDAPPS